MSVTMINRKIAEIGRLRGKNAKQAALENTTGPMHTLLQKFFKQALDPRYNYGTTIVPKKLRRVRGILSDHMLIRKIDAIAQAHSIVDKRNMWQTLVDIASEDQLVYITRVIKRKPDCGVNLHTIQKVWPGLIKEQAYMGLKSENEEKILKDIEKALKASVPVYYARKEAGTHIITEVMDGNIDTLSRQGEYVNVPAGYEWHVNLLLQGDTKDAYIVGEALGKGRWQKFSKEAEGNGMIREGDTSKMVIVLFDIAKLSDVYGGKEGNKRIPQYRYRLHTLNNLITAYQRTCAEAGVRPLFYNQLLVRIGNPGDYREFADRDIAAGYEGGVVVLGNTGWKPGKPAGRWKAKYQQDNEALITGWYPHKQKPHLIGGFNCIFKGEEHDDIIFNVGSGLTAAMREADPEEFISNSVTVRFTDITRAAKSRWYSLKNPRVTDTKGCMYPPQSTDAVFRLYKDRTGRVHPLLETGV